MRLLALICFALPTLAQVLLIEGDSAFVVPPGATVDLRVVLSSSSLGGNVAGARIEFLTRQGSFAGQPRFATQTDSAGRATARFTTPSTPGFFAVDAAAALGDGALVSFAFTVTSTPPPSHPEAARATLRRDLLRNAADGATLQLIGPWLLPAGAQIRPALWSKDKLAGGLWQTDAPAWFFWVDDGPAKSWAKPTRYLLQPITPGASPRIAGELWWPLLRTDQSDWLTLGRATSYLGNLITYPSAGTGPNCLLLWGNDGQPGAAETLAAAATYFRAQGFTRSSSNAAELTGCQQTRLVIAAAASPAGIYLDQFIPWAEIPPRLQALGELTVLIESNQGASAEYWWTGYNLRATLISATDAERLAYVHPLQGGYLRRGLLPALARLSGDFSAAVQETLRGELVVSSPRPRVTPLPSGPRRFLLSEVEFTAANQLQYIALPVNLTSPVLTLSDPSVALTALRDNRLILQAQAPGRTLLTLSGDRDGQPWQAQTTVSYGLGTPTLRGCLIVAGQTQCLGQHQRRIPVAEDEIGGHAFLQVTDPNIATVDSNTYTYNRGERNIPLRLQGLAPGRTTLQVRSHDGNALADIPVYVAAPPPTFPGVTPTACPTAATFRATFTVSGGDTSLFEPFGGAWWGEGITLVFRTTSPGNFELRASGTTEGQFFAMGGTLNPDCSFLGSGQGVAGQRITTAQVRGRIQSRNGAFDLMNLDYSIGVDGVFPRPIEYRGTAPLLAGCRVSVTPAEPLTATGGIFPLAVSTPPLCPWSASLTGSGTILAGQLGFGPGVIWLELPTNPGPARPLNLTLDGQPLNLSQPGFAPAPTLWVNPVTGGPWVSPGQLLFRPDARSPLFLAPSQLPRATNVILEPTVPGILTVSGNTLEANGLHPTLPLLVEVDGRERRVLSRTPLGWGVEALTLDGPALSPNSAVTLRQGGRSAQRGAFRM